MSARTATRKKDFYKILQVPRSSTSKEIKDAYRKLALRLHPDKNGGCSVKTKQFKDVSEAYAILIDEKKRSDYDVDYTYRPKPPPIKRRVYRPVVPPHMKGKPLYNAQKHYDMHYGDGFLNEAIKNFKRDNPDAYEYQSPLGKGFRFDYDDFTTNTTTGTTGAGSSSTETNANDTNKTNNRDDTSSTFEGNPYSKKNRNKHSQQGGGGGAQRRVMFDYEEVTNFGKQQMRRKNRIVQNLHTKRVERHNLRKQQQNEQHDANDTMHQQAAAFTTNANARQPRESACIIM